MLGTGMKYFYRKISRIREGQDIFNNIPINGIIFDMDGTLTVPVLNFKLLREQLGIAQTPGVDILAFAEGAPSLEEKKERYKIIEDFEDEGNQRLTLQPNLHQLFYFLHENSIPRSLLTRNNRKAVENFVAKFIQEDKAGVFKDEMDIFSSVLTRDFTPAKPHPAPIHHICSQWKVAEESVMMVGDDITDIKTGAAAGSVTVRKLTSSTENVEWGEDLLIDDLSELIGILDTSFDVHRKS